MWLDPAGSGLICLADCTGAGAGAGASARLLLRLDWRDEAVEDDVDEEALLADDALDEYCWWYTAAATRL